LKDRLNPAKTEKGGKLGDVADFLLDKTGGKAGTVASRLSVGSRAVERIRGGKPKAPKKSDENPSDRGEDESAFKRLPIPIQESMEVAIPVKAVYELVRRFEDYPEFIERIEDVEWIDDKTAVFEVKVRGVKRSVRVEIAEERPNRRIDWEATEGLDHSGVITFHELAPTLTRLELTIDLEPNGLIPRLARTVHVTQHAIRSDMHRFKAWAELAEDVEEPEDLGEEPKRQEESGEAAAPEEEKSPEDYEDEAGGGQEEEDGEPEDLEEEELPKGSEDEELEEEGPDEDYEEPGMEDESYDDEEEEELAPARAH
jgi:uncharacterized membrane protein